jgi:hypothetical protein
MVPPSAYLTFLCLQFVIVLYFLVNLERILKKRATKHRPKWFLWTYSENDPSSRFYRWFCYAALGAMLIMDIWLIIKSALELASGQQS